MGYDVMTRRKWFVLAAVAILWMGLVRNSPAQTKPNVLIIIPDQMRGDALSAVDHPVVETPNIDQLAREGTLFRRAYADVPSCIPTRYALMTGMSPQKSGVVGYTGTRVTRKKMPQTFQNAGYRTALVGRWMHLANSTHDLGYQDHIKGSVLGPKGDYVQYLKERLSPDSKYGKKLYNNGLRPMVESMGLTYNLWHARPWPLNDDWHPTAWTARQSRKWVKQVGNDQPLFLTTSFYAPHPPLFPPEKYFRKYLNKDLPEPAWGDWVDQDNITKEGRLHNTRVLLNGKRLDRAQAGYFGLIEHIDRQMGPLIRMFIAKSSRMGRPWVIAFVSEHGEMLGDHGYFRKCEAYEGSANVPYIIAGSDGLQLEKDNRSMEPVGLRDLFPTLAKLAGVPIPEQVDGKSLVPVLFGNKKEVREIYHFEHDPTYSDAQAFHALTDGRYKYIWRPLNGGKEQLFDLKNDPHEEQDLSDDAEHRDVLKRMRNELIDRLEDRPEGFSDGEKLIPGQTYKAHMPGKEP